MSCNIQTDKWIVVLYSFQQSSHPFFLQMSAMNIQVSQVTTWFLLLVRIKTSFFFFFSFPGSHRCIQGCHNHGVIKWGGGGGNKNNYWASKWLKWLSSTWYKIVLNRPTSLLTFQDFEEFSWVGNELTACVTGLQFSDSVFVKNTTKIWQPNHKKNKQTEFAHTLVATKTIRKISKNKKILVLRCSVNGFQRRE